MANQKNSKIAFASQRTIRISAFKVRPVLNLVRGKSIGEAVSVLQAVNYKVCPILIKLINSATANAVNNQGLDASKLMISYLVANEGATLKRMMPRAKGAADRISKRTCHLEVKLAEKE